MPADGLCPDTRPAGTIGSGASVRVPKPRPASAIARRASDSLLFLRSGTGTLSADVATVTLTSPPLGIRVPDGEILGEDRARRLVGRLAGLGELDPELVRLASGVGDLLADEVGNADLDRPRCSEPVRRPRRA